MKIERENHHGRLKYISNYIVALLDHMLMLGCLIGYLIKDMYSSTEYVTLRANN